MRYFCVLYMLFIGMAYGRTYDCSMNGQAIPIQYKVDESIGVMNALSDFWGPAFTFNQPPVVTENPVSTTVYDTSAIRQSIMRYSVSFQSGVIKVPLTGARRDGSIISTLDSESGRTRIIEDEPVNGVFLTQNYYNYDNSLGMSCGAGACVRSAGLYAFTLTQKTRSLSVNTITDEYSPHQFTISYGSLMVVVGNSSTPPTPTNNGDV
ncbi:TPA: hypothetical protein ACY3HI_001983 [Citrobacter braakii]